MSIWALLILIALAWLTYPFAGAANVSADVAEGKRPQGAGFSFLPELLIYPVAFLGLSFLIDIFDKPLGKWFVAFICIVMLLVNAYTLVKSWWRIRSVSKSIA